MILIIRALLATVSRRLVARGALVVRIVVLEGVRRMRLVVVVRVLRVMVVVVKLRASRARSLIVYMQSAQGEESAVW